MVVLLVEFYFSFIALIADFVAHPLFMLLIF